MIRSSQANSRRASVLSVLGELLLTAGAIVLLFLGWQLWWNDLFAARQQTASAQEQSREWHGEWDRSGAQREPSGRNDQEPVVADQPDLGATIANLYVPRFGPNYVRTIAEGTGSGILDSFDLGVGHYVGTQMPGAVGNFAVAAHRSAYGGGMHLIDQLVVGDPIVIESAAGWYVYRYRSTEYVTPSQVSVLEPVPNRPGQEPTDRIITLTSCNPLYSTAERIIAYGVFSRWVPRSEDPPAELAERTDAAANTSNAIDEGRG